MSRHARTPEREYWDTLEKVAGTEIALYERFTSLTSGLAVAQRTLQLLAGQHGRRRRTIYEPVMVEPPQGFPGLRQVRLAEAHSVLPGRHFVKQTLEVLPKDGRQNAVNLTQYPYFSRPGLRLDPQTQGVTGFVDLTEIMCQRPPMVLSDQEIYGAWLDCVGHAISEMQGTQPACMRGGVEAA